LTFVNFALQLQQLMIL